jgi:septal ring factor EnvC (AmiA/AmiB activator)
MAIALCVLPATADEKGSLGKIEQNLDQRRAERERLGQQTKRVKSEISALQRKLVAKAGRMQAAEEIARESKARLAELRKRESFLSREMTQDREEIANLLAALLRLRRQPAVIAMATAHDAAQTARTAHLLAVATSELDRRAETMRGELVRLASLRAGIEEQHRLLQGNALVLSKDRGDIKRLLSAKRALHARLRQKDRATANEVEKLAAKARDLRSLISRLEERRRRLAAERQKAEARRMAEAEAARKARAEAVRGMAEAPATTEAKKKDAIGQRDALAKAVPDRQVAMAPSVAFSKRRGSLPLPARGPIIKSYGATTRFGTITQGVTVETVDDAQVVSPHGGEIVFAGPFRDYGVVLIISHGEGYHTLLAGIGRSYVAVGQRVLAGEPVAQMGEGSKKNRSLYVELRRKGSAIDPRSWWARTRS